MSPRAYRLGARSAVVEENRAKVVKAAVALFAEAGFHGTSLEEVAGRADVARATVYHQFGSKLGLLEAVVRDFEERAGLNHLVRTVEEAPLERLVRAVVTDGCRYWATDPALVRTIIHVAATDSGATDLIAQHDAGRLRLLRRVVTRLQRAGRLAPGCSPARALDVLWVLTSFAAYDLLAGGRDRSIASAARTLADLAELQLERVV